MTPEQAYQNLEAIVLQALGAGLFKDFNNVGYAQQSLLTIKNVIDEKTDKEKEGNRIVTG